MNLILADSPDEIPILHAVDSQVPLALLMPTRREMPQAWQRLWQTHIRTGSSFLLVLDKTQTGSASSFFLRQARESDSCGTVILLRRPFDEDPLRSLGKISFAQSVFVMQFHDDDDWKGAPSLPQDANDLMSFEVTTRRNTSSPEAGLDGHLSRFYGAVRGDIWTRFTHHFGSHPWGRNETLDQTLAFLLATMGRSGVMETYTYIYNNDNWATWEKAVESTSRSMQRLGWNTEYTLAASHWSQLLDDIEVLNLFSDYLSDEQVDVALKGRLKFPLAPAVTTTMEAKMWRRCPAAIRASIVCSRGLGRGWERLRTAVRTTPHFVRSACDTKLLGGYGVISLDELEDRFIPNLRRWSTPELAPQFSQWTDSVSGVRARMQSPSHPAK